MSCQAGWDGVYCFSEGPGKLGWRLPRAMREGSGVKNREWLVTPNHLVLRRREAASKDAPGGANEATNWTILRDAALRAALRMRSVGPFRSSTWAVTMARKWRRKPLKSLKTDSMIPSARSDQMNALISAIRRSMGRRIRDRLR